jgi:hypothetical protein
MMKQGLLGAAAHVAPHAVATAHAVVDITPAGGVSKGMSRKGEE